MMHEKRNDEPKTSWGGVAEWYDALLEREGTYQKDIILPNLLRLMEVQKGEALLDLACGPGFFAREFFKHGAHVIGVDISRDLIAIAQKNSSDGIAFHASGAHKMPFIENESVDKIVLILALQNMDDPQGVIKECWRVLKPQGKIFIVMNHPAFRIPQRSSWEWDAKQKMQYRRIDGYLSESKAKIQMHPGADSFVHTISYHRPLQFYVKALEKNQILISCLEEWISHKKSEPGPRASAENRIRKEIPLFLFLEGVKLK